MSFCTTIKSKDGKHAFSFVTEHYIVGTYCITTMLNPKTFSSTSSYEQGGSQQKANALHKACRKQAIKNGDIVVDEESTPMSMIEESTKAFWEKNKEYDSSIKSKKKSHEPQTD